MRRIPHAVIDACALEAHNGANRINVQQRVGVVGRGCGLRCDTLDSILRAHAAPKEFDLLSIDIEGHELVALSGFSFSNWRPKLVLIEDHVTHLDKHRLMKHSAYQLLLRSGLNSWYVPKELPYTFSPAAWFEYFRKYFLGLPVRKLRYLLEAGQT